MTFTIDTDNNISVFATQEEAAASTTTAYEFFSSEKELTQLASAWPAERLVVIYNGLPGAKPVKTFKAAKAGATTGEWAQTMRDVFGAYRGPTGVDGAAPPTSAAQLDPIRAQVEETSQRIGHRIKILVGKPGLDGHSNGSEQIALRARDVGMEVIYQGIRLTPAEIAESALQEDVDVVGLSILSGSHLALIPEVVGLLREEGVDVPVVIGGIIPAADAKRLSDEGVAGVYTPKDFDINKIMGEIVTLVGQRAGAGSPA